LDEDGANEASGEDEESEGGGDEGAESDLEDRGEGAGNEAGFAISRDDPCGECQVIFLAQ